ncbi:MAG: hypothetical protein IT380_23235 [Myxococcales bacterium]|nr:hypothetical protein [Myxococcales bacterium]
MTQQVSRALALGALVGFLVAAFPACGSRPPITRCNASNCDGCCDETGSCFKGISREACGAAGASCAVCATGQTCDKLDPLKEFGGKCGTPGTGGGSGGGTGGGSGGGSGGGTGGGSGGGSGGGGGGTGGGGGAMGCNATNCSNGCCTASGTCVTQLTPSRCGTGGAQCAPCTMGNTCVSGTCTPCAGCVDVSTGNCLAGNTNMSCGSQGVFCQMCDTGTGQNCTGGACMGGGTCSATNCATGCCDGNTCVQPSMFSNARCGVGVPGGACQTCQGVSVCDLDAGTCVGGQGGGFGGGIGGGGGGLPFDGGLPDLCSLLGTPCTAGQCCDLIFILPACVNNGEACFMGGTCDGAAMACQ